MMNINIFRIAIFFYCIAIGFFFYTGIQPWTLDDAFITFRYAENWVDGYGLVYNPGEYVEGYTSFIWVLMLACCYFMGFSTLIAAKILCVFFSVVNLLLVMFAHRFIPSIKEKESMIAALMLGTSGVFIPWSFSGMETSLFCLLVTLQFLYAIDSIQQNTTFHFCLLGIISSLTILCRPEGVMVAGLVILYFFYVYRSTINYPFIKSISYFILPVGITITAQYGLRFCYYGEWQPNTYYVKVGASFAQLFRGFDYVTDFIPVVLGMLVFTAIAFFNYPPFRRTTFNQLFIAAAILFNVYCIVVGGDSMPAFRFLVPVMPLVCILAAQSICLLFSKPKHLLLAIFILVSINAYHVFFNWHIHGHILSDRVALNGREVGLWLKENLPKDAVIATNTAGSIAYYSELRTIDMLGLTDKHIAHRELDDMGQGSAGHEKGDGFYVLSRKPDVIQFASSLGALQPMFRSGKEMVELPEFHSHYEARVTGLPNGKDTVLYFRY